MSTWTSPSGRDRRAPADETDAARGADSAFDTGSWERALDRRLVPARWLGWRLRALVPAALIGCLAMFLLIRTLAALPALGVVLRTGGEGSVEVSTPSGWRALRGIEDISGSAIPVDALLLHRSGRWLIDDAVRARHAALHDQLARGLAAGPLQLVLADGERLTVAAQSHGAGGLGALFWVLSTLALMLYLVAMVVLLVKPGLRNALYAIMALAQVGNLVLLGIESITALGLPAGFMHRDASARMAFDLVTGAALLHATATHPRRLPALALRAAAAWLVAGALSVAIAMQILPHGWWWAQAATIALGLLAIAQLSRSHRLEPDPRAVVLRRFTAVAVGTLVLLTLSLAVVGANDGTPHPAAALGAAIWVVFVASLLLMLPFLSRSQHLMREFSLLAGVSTVATSLDLLFAAVFSFGQFTSLTLALFIALGLYAGVRQWLLNHMLANQVLTAERMFEQLYRVAREVEARPQSVGDALARLMRELFDPLEVTQLPRKTGRTRIIGDGSTLLVPVPVLSAEASAGSLVLRYAQRGKRLFSAQDARLADRVVDQLTRAVAFDQAVERGRNEERVRIAQDLHDDIGARLLTLMYKAATPEIEDYVRHTLKDLKTLTRGLAAPSHRLSHAVAEWKSDIAQRLAAADCALGWSFAYDSDFELSVVQWSALTRVLRELVSNTIAHAQATRVEIEASLEGGRLLLQVRDNGHGRAPQAWSHGLGLGGVRKRVKQLGGEVQWQENAQQGIVCRVMIAELVPSA